MKKISLLLLVLLTVNSANAQNYKSLNIGQVAPQVKFNKVLDQKLAANFYENKFLVLDFWATWCAPCIASFPHFNSLSNQFKSEKVIFATITDEPEITATTFFKRTQKKVDGFKLIDTSKFTNQAFGASSIPFCVVVDQKNKVRWQGNTADLTPQLLQEIINTPSPEAAVAEGKPISFLEKFEALKKNIVPTYFRFSAIKGEAGKPKGGSSVGSPKSDYYEIKRNNTTIGDFLGELAGYSKQARFTTNDTLKLNQLVSIDYSSNRGYEKFAAEYAGRFIPNRPRTNYLIFLLQSTFNFNFKEIEKEMDVYEMVVADQKKLDSFKSLQTGHASFSDDYFPKFEIVGYDLNGISQELEKSFKQIIVSKIQDQNRYDLSLDVNTIEKLNQTLAFHGLQLKKVNTKVKMIAVDFN